MLSQFQQMSQPPSTATSTERGTTETMVQLSNEHAQAVRSTEDHACSKETTRSHNRKLKKLIEWMRTNYPNESASMIRELTDEEKEDRERFYQSSHDLLYGSLDPLVVKAFISANKVREIKEDGTEVFYGFDHLRKYKDAVLFGAKRSRTTLSSQFYAEINPFIESLKKENQSKRKLGQLTEKEADPISFPLYRQICESALQKGDIFLWCFTVMQWNCIARSINIGNLRFNSLTVGQDSIVIKYWDTKKDKTGEKTCPKNCYANPKDPTICLFTSLGCYLATNDETYKKDSKETIFLSPDTKEKAASQKYCRKLASFLKNMNTTVREFIRPDHANAHGIRKGSATKATSGTTCPPPPASVAHRGEWSLGKVFDIYWLYAECGDQYLGRILAGLDPNALDFAILPPHFVEGLENIYIQEGMKMCYKNLLFIESNGGLGTNISGILLRCLASIVYHSQKLKEIMHTSAGHPLNQISILNNQNLLNKLLPLITTKPSVKITSPTGIPPHVTVLVQLENVVSFLKKEKEERGNWEKKLQEIVENKIEENARQNGHLTYSALTEILQSQKAEFSNQLAMQTENINSRLTQIIASLQNDQPTLQNNVTDQLPSSSVRGNLYSWGGKFYQVPRNFAFPKSTKRRAAWDLWIWGQDSFQLEDGTAAPIIPFRNFDPRLLPMKQRLKYKVEWRPVLQKMCDADGLPNLNTQNLTQDLVDASYVIATEHLKQNVCRFIFEQPNKYKRIEQWSVSTWSRYVSYQYIVDHGFPSDKANLPTATRLNSKRKRRINSNAELTAHHQETPRGEESV